MTEFPTPWDVAKLIYKIRKEYVLSAIDNRLLDGLLANLIKGLQPSKYEAEVAKKWGIIPNDD